MVTLSVGDSLEIGGLAGARIDEVFVRAFEIVNGDTFMGRTHIAVGSEYGFTRLATFDIEIVDLHYASDIGLVCLCGNGQVYSYRAGVWSEIAAPIQPATRVSTLRLIEGSFYSMGPRNGLYQLDEASVWLKLSIADIGTHFLDMASAKKNEFFICGTDGYFARYFEGVTTQIDLATDVHLVSILVTDRQLYVSGHSSTLIFNEGDDWSFVNVEGRDTDFLKLLMFNLNVLIAAEVEILRVENGIVETFAQVNAQKLYVIDNCLFAKGLDSIALLQSDAWRNFPVSFDVPDQVSATAIPKA